MATNQARWLEEHKEDFIPPVCNKLMEEKQLKVMFVGGPNQRDDYHIEEGEELFYQRQGDMCLKVMERGKPKDIIIKEGEIFVLPGRIPHSPNRYENTMGLVLERDRLDDEIDGLRYYVDKTNQQVLFERWFHCFDLGVQLGPVIKEFFASEQYKTRIPEATIGEPPFPLDSTTELSAPIPLKSLVDGVKNQRVSLFNRGETVVDAVEGIATEQTQRPVEVLLWQLSGKATVNDTEIGPDDFYLVPSDTPYSVQRGPGSLTLEIFMDPALSPYKQ